MTLKSFRELADHLATSTSPLAENLRERRDRQVVFGAGKAAARKPAKDAAWRRIIERNKARMRDA